jgi:FtsH-binding integral membrane protein
MKDYYGEGWTDTRKEEFISTGSANAFLRQVYLTMAFGLGLTGLTSWYFGTRLQAQLLELISGNPILMWAIMLAPLGFVLVLSFGLEKMSFTVASLVFGAYSLVNGISLSFIFMIYTQASIAKVFLIAGSMFGLMALAGMTTKIDLSKYSSFLYMGVIGLIVAMVVNMFLKSGPFDFLISIIGVVIFLALTAYDTQRLMQIGAHAEMEDERTQKATIIGALALYLDFINLFLFLLRLLGSRK